VERKVNQMNIRAAIGTGLLVMNVFVSCSVMNSFSAEISLSESKTIQDAFASVQREGKPYNTFYTYYVAPHAVEENGHIYVAFQDGEGRPIVMAYHINNRSWNGPVRASDFGLGKDTHGNPSICIDRKGFIHIFFGCHGREMKHIRSVSPYNIHKWQDESSPTSRATYPQSMRMNDGRIFLFYRAGGHMEPWSLRISKNDGKTWSEPDKIIEMRLDPPDRRAAAYCAFMPGAENKTVHCFYVHKDDNPTRVDIHPWRPLLYHGLHEAVYRYNVYYIHRNEAGKWIGAHGSTLELPLSKAESDFHTLVFDSGNEFASTKRMVIGKDDTPYIRFSVGVEDWKYNRVIVPYKTWYASPREGHWNVANNIPTQWPKNIQDLIQKNGASAYGDVFPNPWFIFHERGPEEDPSATYIWLAHIEKGYAKRQDGAAHTINKN